jgi:hypothetical protein
VAGLEVKILPKSLWDTFFLEKVVKKSKQKRCLQKQWKKAAPKGRLLLSFANTHTLWAVFSSARGYPKGAKMKAKWDRI